MILSFTVLNKNKKSDLKIKCIRVIRFHLTTRVCIIKFDLLLRLLIKYFIHKKHPMYKQINTNLLTGNVSL